MADIVGRIKKLLQRAQHPNANPEEAAAALALAQELKFKYDIGDSDLDMGEDKRTPEEIVEESVAQGGGSRVETWKNVLANTVARAFGCKMWYDPYAASGVRFHILGTKSATQTVTYMFSCLHPEIDRMAREEWDKAKAEGTTRDAARTFLNSFRMGAVATITKRLAEQINAQEALLRVREKADKEKAPEQRSVALALYRGDQERVAEAYAEKEKKLGLRSARRTSSRRNWTAYDRGRDAGHKLNLGNNKALGADKQRIEE